MNVKSFAVNTEPEKGIIRMGDYIVGVASPGIETE